MAGESPDKSGKKQASGKVRGADDPRLAVLRREPAEATEKTTEATEPEKVEEAGRGAAGAAEASGVTEAPKGPEKATDGASEVDVTSEAAESVESAESAEANGAAKNGAAKNGAAKNGNGPGDDRLRAAVAAWVAGKDDDPESADGSDAPDDADAEATDGDTDDAADGEGAKGSAKAIGAAAEGAKGSPAKAAEPSGTDAGDDSGTRPEADDTTATRDDTTGADGADDARGESADDAEPAGEAKAESGDAGKKSGGKRPKGAEAKAADRKASDAEDPAAKDGKATAGAGDGDASVTDGGDAPDEDDDVDRPTAVFTTKGKKSAPDEEPADDATRVFTIAKSDAKRKPTAKTEAAAEADGESAEPAKDPRTGGTKDKAEPKPAEKNKAEPKGKDGDKAEADEKDGADADPVDPPTTAFRIAPPTGSKSAKVTEPGKDEKAEKAAKAEKADAASSKDAKDSDAKTAKGEPEPGGKSDKDGKAAGKGGGKSAGAERDAERTSQFVALKSDDTGAAGRSLGKTAAKADEKDAAAKAGAATGATASGKPGADKPGTDKSAAGAATSDKPATDKTDKTGGAAAAAGPQPLPESERTRQEPLPPLDLLAQLTNTPPPPETTLRTVVRRFKIWTPLVILLAIIFVVVQSLRTLPEPTLAVGESTAFTFKGGKLDMPWPGQGQSAAEVVGVGSLGTSGPQKPVPTASVAKVMTAYVILRDHPLKKGEKGDTITIDAKAAADSKNKDESRVPLKEGQRFNQTQMLQMLMIPSGNNAARQLARWDAGSEEAFVKKMNAAAGKLGMTNTTYTDPSGLTKTTVSTAVDQLKLAREVMKNGAFRAVVATENVQIDGLPERLFNNNSLLTTMPYVVRGIKTGSSTPAGGAFMWAAYRTVGGKDQLLIGVTMDQRTSSSDPNAHLKLALDNSAKVITAAREALIADTVVKKGQVVGYVDDGLGGETPVVATKDLTAVGWPGLQAAFSIGNGGKTVPHTAKAGTEVGVLTVGSGDSTQQVPVALAEDLTEPGFGAKLTRIG
ncbi:D-alanyl-D-alanine carboxypeptidase family protein [Streptomyces catenulae]|uniref:D-alanyl-D-alanine carboxypeptidase n=1 Tax=Streptomyces catenulae TaxID=66875 RepID=A0ABV2Z464_9ACTN|nr:hypothetical protein [Streptomyces catenulae]